MHSKRRTLRPVLPLLATVAVLVSCTGTATTPTQAPASPTATAAPTGPLPLRAAALAAGTYTTTAFRPTIVFTIDGGWRGLFPDDDDEVALEAAGGVIFAVSRVSKVVDPTSGAAAAAPEDLVAWFSDDPTLTVSTPEAVTVGGVSGHMVDLKVTDGSEHEIFAFPTGNLRIPAGVTYRCYVLPLVGPDMTVIIGAPNAGFTDAVKKFRPVIDSFVIDTDA